MNHFGPHIPPPCHNTPVARTVDPSGPVAIRALCEWRNGPNPGPWQTADPAEPLCQRACMWHHVTPAAVWDLGQSWAVLCTQSQGTPLCARADYPAVSRLLFRGSGRTTPAFSHCEVVWEKHSSLDPGENNIRTSQTRACVPVQTVVTGLAAVSLLRHPRLAVITSPLKGWKEMNVWIEKNSPFRSCQPSSCFSFCLFSAFIWVPAEGLECASNKKPVLTRGFPAVMSHWELVLEGKLSPFNLLFSGMGK